MRLEVTEAGQCRGQKKKLSKRNRVGKINVKKGSSNFESFLSKIEDVKFDGDACAICTSASSVMTKELKGKSLEEAEVIIENFERMINELPYDEEVLGELNIYNEVYKQPSRKKCALLPMGSIKKIIEDEE